MANRDGDGDGDIDRNNHDGDEDDRAADDRAADGDGDGDQGPDSWNAEIHFSVVSKLVSSSESTSDPLPFQSLQTKGNLTIMVSYFFI